MRKHKNIDRAARQKASEARLKAWAMNKDGCHRKMRGLGFVLCQAYVDSWSRSSERSVRRGAN